VDILLTGDKDFLESAVTRPKIITAARFMQNDISIDKLHISDPENS
jgi:hypothetical protein